jgi:phosphoribosylformylglycinamidine synthase
MFGTQWGQLSALDVAIEAEINVLLVELAKDGLIHSAADIGSGGLAVCLARCAGANGLGVDVDPMVAVGDDGPDALDALSVFMETGGSVVITCDPSQAEEIARRAHGIASVTIGTVTQNEFKIRAIDGREFISADIQSLMDRYLGDLESQIADEVVTA